MGRRVVTPLTLGGRAAVLNESAVPPAVSADGYPDRLVKYIPAEVITLFAATSKSVAAFTTWEDSWRLGFALFGFVFCLGATAVLTYVQTREPGKPVAIEQIAIATAAFAIWALALGIPEIEQRQDLRILHREVWQFILPFYTFSVALYVPRRP
jgi:hypothetical protein